MKFHLDFYPEKPGYFIQHPNSLFLIGSCFTENIGNKFSSLRFKTLQSPSGILFNPVSIYQNLTGILYNQPFNTNLILLRDNLYFSYHHHSSVYAQSPAGLIQKIEEETKAAFSFIKNCDYIFITFGTAYYYYHSELNQTVANCHKQPQQLFIKKLIQPNEIIETYSSLVSDLLKLRPDIKIIFTVSPVKHLRDGVVGNSISKSILLLSVYEICKTNKSCYYFPAYELVNDDLRDYRFYAKDLAHPNDEAIQYVWNKFSECFFDEKTRLINSKIEQLNKSASHKHNTDFTSENLAFKKHITELTQEIDKLAPGLLY